MTVEPVEGLWTHREAARWLRISEWMLYQLVAAGDGPPAYWLRRERRYEPGEVRAWLRARRVMPDRDGAADVSDGAARSAGAGGMSGPDAGARPEGSIVAALVPTERWEGRDWQADAAPSNGGAADV